MVERYEEGLNTLMREVFDVMDDNGLSKGITNKLASNFQTLQQQIGDIRNENRKV